MRDLDMMRKEILGELDVNNKLCRRWKELVTPSSVIKLPKVAGILRGYINTSMPNSAIFQTGISYGIRGDKNVESLTVPINNSYQNINTNNDGSALEIDKEKNKKLSKNF